MQYPHILKYFPVNTSIKDYNGDFVNTSGAVVEYPCRAESSSGNGFNNGKIDYSWIVYFPLSTPFLNTGASVEVYQNGHLLCKETIKRFSQGQMNCRAWL